MSGHFGDWIGLLLGCLFAFFGTRWALRPKTFVGIGLIRFTDPQTIRYFGIIVFLFGLLDAGISLSRLLSE